MKHLRTFARVILLIFAFASISFAQEVANPSSESAGTLPKMLPPTPSEFTQPGEGKFVIFTREETGKEWDFVAGVWECIPSRPNTPVTKRGELCHSSWNATPLLEWLVEDHDSRGLHPRFARLQVNSGDRDYIVHLYDINYRTWQAKCIWQGKRLGAFGVQGESIFCSDGDEWFLVHSASGEIHPEAPFTPLDAEEDFWLVRKPGETQGCWSYNRHTRKFITHFNEVDQPLHGVAWSRLSKDGLSRAWMLLPKPSGWRGGQISGQLILQRNGEAKDITVPIEVQASVGSGFPIIPRGVRFQFTPEGQLQLRSSTDRDKANVRVWSIDIATGSVNDQIVPQEPPIQNTKAMLDGVVVPDYLEKELQHLGHFGRSGLAPAFLMHMGILKSKPSYPDCTAGASRDGRHVLYRAKKGPLAGIFFYGDLQAKQVVRWESPRGLKPGAVLDFVWVETPR